jgi:hypothetical protein
MNVRFLFHGRWADGIHRPQFDVEHGDIKTVGDAPGEVTFATAEYAVSQNHAEFTNDEAPPAAPSESTKDSAPANSEQDEDPTA